MSEATTPRVKTLTLRSIVHGEFEAADVAIAGYEYTKTGTYPKHVLLVEYEQAMSLLDWALNTIERRSMEFEYVIRKGRYTTRNEIAFASWRGLDDQALTLDFWPVHQGDTQVYSEPFRKGHPYLYDINFLDQLLRNLGFTFDYFDGVKPQPTIERTPNTVVIDGQTYVRLAEERETD